MTTHYRTTFPLAPRLRDLNYNLPSVPCRHALITGIGCVAQAPTSLSAYSAVSPHTGLSGVSEAVPSRGAAAYGLLVRMGKALPSACLSGL